MKIPEALRTFLIVTWICSIIVLIAVTIASQDQLQSCSRGIYPLLLALYFGYFLNPLPDKQAVLIFFIKDLASNQFYGFALFNGFIGSIGLTYMIQIENETPDCFDGGFHPKWIAWAVLGHGMLLALAVMVGGGVLSLITFFTGLIPQIFKKLKKICKRRICQSETAQIGSRAFREEGKDLLSLIKAEIGKADLSKSDFENCFEYIDKVMMSNDYSTLVGIKKEDFEHIPKVQNGELNYVARSNILVPTKFESNATEELLGILETIDLELLNLPIITAWINMFFEKYSKILRFHTINGIFWDMIVVAFVLINEQDLLYCQLFILLGMGVSLFNSTYNLITSIKIPSPDILIQIPRYLFILTLMIFNWVGIAPNELRYEFVAAFLILTLLVNTILSLAAFQNIRKFMILLKEILKDFIPFMVILIVSILGFSFAFHVYFRNQINGSTMTFNTYGHSLFNALSLTLGGFDLSDDSPFNVHYLLTGFGAFFLNVIMLSILIALMGETQGNVSSTGEAPTNKIKIGFLMMTFRAVPMILDKKVKIEKDEYDYMYWYENKKDQDTEENIVVLKKQMNDMFKLVKEMNRKIDLLANKEK